MGTPLSIYIHIPFCNKRCDYCHFYVVTGLNQLIPQYVEALVTEIAAAKTQLQDFEVTTIYLGGGTPSLLSPGQFTKILDAVRTHAVVSKTAEITLEANPEDLSFEKLNAFHTAGVNRLSIGLQAAQNHLLNYLGRSYSREKFADLVKDVRASGFTNFNIDLIFGIPNQTMAEWKDSVDFALSFQPAHLSCYSLELDHQSLLGQKYRQGLVIPPSDSENRAFYHLTQQKLAAAGFTQYELSNYAQPGNECKHNLNFWHNQSYLGFGAGAHSFFNNETWSRVPVVATYLKQITNQNLEKIDLVTIPKNELEQQGFILGLRLIAGVSKKTLPKILDAAVTKLLAAELITLQNDCYRLTTKGQDVFDEVARQIFSA